MEQKPIFESKNHRSEVKAALWLFFNVISILFIIPISIILMGLLFPVTNPIFCIMAIVLPIVGLGLLLRIGEQIVQDQIIIYDSYIEIIKPGTIRFLKPYVTTIQNQDMISVGGRSKSQINIHYRIDDLFLKSKHISVNYKMTKRSGVEELDEVLKILKKIEKENRERNGRKSDK